jgi:hypothetical protein
MAGYLAKPPHGSPLLRGDPLARALTAAWLFGDARGATTTATRIRNAAAPGRYDLTCPATNFTIGAGIDGPAITRTGTSSPKLTPAVSLTSTTTHSIALRLNVTSVSASYHNVIDSGATAAGLYVANSGGACQLKYYSAGDKTATNTFPVGRWADVACTVNAGAIRFYVDGALDPSTNTGGVSGNWDSLFSNVSNQWLAAQIAYLYVWVGRVLTARDVADLRADPYRMFRRRRVPVPLSAPAPAGSYTITADAGSFALSGQAAALRAARLLSAAAGSFTLTGGAASLEYGRVLAAGAGSFALAGQDAGLRAVRTLAGGAGTFTLSGQAAGLVVARRLDATTGSYALTGADAGLAYSGAAKVLAAEAGAFTLTGGAAGLFVGRRVAGGTGVFVLAGQAATLTYSGDVPTPARTYVVPGRYTAARTLPGAYAAARTLPAADLSGGS